MTTCGDPGTSRATCGSRSASWGGRARPVLPRQIVTRARAQERSHGPTPVWDGTVRPTSEQLVSRVIRSQRFRVRVRLRPNGTQVILAGGVQGGELAGVVRDVPGANPDKVTSFREQELPAERRTRLLPRPVLCRGHGSSARRAVGHALGLVSEGRPVSADEIIQAPFWHSSRSPSCHLRQARL